MDQDAPDTQPKIEQIPIQISPEIEPRQVIARIVFNQGTFPDLESAQKFIETHFLISDWKKKIATGDVDWLRIADVDSGGVG